MLVVGSSGGYGGDRVGVVVVMAVVVMAVMVVVVVSMKQHMTNVHQKLSGIVQLPKLFSCKIIGEGKVNFKT